MDIFNYIRAGKNVVSLNLGKSFKGFLEADEEEYNLLVPNTVLLDEWSMKELFSKYYFHELIELSNCYLGTGNEPYVLWHISKKEPESIKLSLFYEYAHDYRDEEINSNFVTIPDRFRENYKLYIKCVEKWIEGEPYVGQSDCWEFINVPKEDFDYMRPFSRYYRTSNNETRNLLKGENFLRLGDIADVTWTHLIDCADAKGKIFDPEHSFKYPYIPEVATIDGFVTSEELHKGDILRFKNKYFLIDKESEFPIYAYVGMDVIRAKKISPEYLYLYLNSKTAQKIKNAFYVPLGNGSMSLYGGRLCDFPILVPQRDSDFYMEEFLKVSTPNIRYYTKEKNKNPQTIEDALAAELLDKIRINGMSLLKKQIDEDIKELDICFSNNAYKASLILAGSILEAVLLDWLSEIRGINYFEEDLKKRKFDKKRGVYKTDKNGQYIYTNKRADLRDYIDEIRDIKEPAWMREAEEAHEIREKRNLVHAKLCLKKNIQIDEVLCQSVIQYLKHVIDSRWR